MDYSSRTITAHGRRNDSIRKWMESETARAPDNRPNEDFKIKFEDGAMLLAAVASGDMDETTRLLDVGADVNYSNIDGLTSLHQACIDENIEMVELLISKGAMLNACDNEGWTPLHAAASTGALDVVRCLVESGADVASVNTEGEVPVDLAEDPEVQSFLAKEVKIRDINLDDARNLEHKCLLNDALKWQKDGVIADVLDSQGATALHVSSSKGYIDVVKILIDIGADVNCSDFDGWTPLHAAVYWKQQAVCELLLQNGAKLYSRNSFGQSPVDLAEDEMVPFMRSLARNYKPNENFGGPDKTLKSLPIITRPNSKIEKSIVGIIKQPKENPIDFNSKDKTIEVNTSSGKRENDDPHSISLPKIAKPPTLPTARPALPNQGKVALPPSDGSSHKSEILKTDKVISRPPTTPSLPPTNTNETEKVVSRPPTAPLFPSNTLNETEKKQGAISKPPSVGIPKPVGPPRPSTSNIPSLPPHGAVPSEKHTKETHVVTTRPAVSIAKPLPPNTQPILSNVTEASQKELSKLEKDYESSIQQLSSVKNELVSVIKERDVLKSKLEKAESSLANYNKLMEENTRLNKENASLVKVIATFNRTASYSDTSNSNTPK